MKGRSHGGRDDFWCRTQSSRASMRAVCGVTILREPQGLRRWRVSSWRRAASIQDCIIMVGADQPRSGMAATVTYLHEPRRIDVGGGGSG